MSTKTTFKRIALVAVASLGFGLMSSVVPANAAPVYTTSISVATNVAPVAGVNGTVVTHTVRFQTSSTAALAIQPRAILTSKPSGSTLALQATTASTNVPPLGKAEFDSGATAATNASADYFTTADSDANSGSEAGYTFNNLTAYLHAHYDVAGTYTWTFFDDMGNQDKVLNGSEVATTVTVVVGGTGSTQTYTATTTGYGLSTVKSGSNGALVRIALKDSAGNATSPDTAGGVKVSLSGTAVVDRVNDGNVDDSSTFILGSGNFNGDGHAWVNMTNTTAETVTMTLSGSGSMASSFTAPSAVAITFTTAVPSTVAPLFTLGAASGLKSVTAMAVGTAGALQANKTSTSLTFKTGKSAATAAAKDKVTITDNSGVITGLANADYDILVTEGTTGCTYCGTFTISGINFGGLIDQTFTLTNATPDTAVITSKTQEATTVTVLSSGSFKSAAGATHTFSVEVQNQFGAAMSGTAVSASIAGRNSTVAVASAITNAGVATLTYTDASTSTTSLTDTVTFSSNSNTDTATITYTTATNFGASTILLTSAKTKTTGADADVLSTMYVDIAAGAAGAQAGIQTVTATVKDSGAVVLAGVPVTFTAAGDGCAILSTKATVYTGATGTAATSVYKWITGKCVVTGTVGTVTDDVNTYWSQQTAEEVRTFTATNSSPRVITVTAKDRFGNPVLAAPFTATITAGDGFFGTGTNVATGTTDSSGVLKFSTLESETALTVRVQAGNPGSATYGQTDASIGLVASVTATDVFDDVVAGTTLDAEEGVGNVAAYTGAGNNIIDVTVAATQSASTVAAEAASDAAAEAIDAANAATDAANLAAEAADAATVAAEEARDAADAATAAVEELATQVATLMAALKAQITTLANTVAKIAKKVKA